jgi:peptide-methionine (S)-S-oxide reductase
MRTYIHSAVLAVLLCVLHPIVAHPSHASEKAAALPPPIADEQSGNVSTGDGLKTIVFAGGCFWGVQAVYQHTTGVVSAVSGYAGGTAATARYDLVARGRTKHAEAVEVTYDPKQISLGTLLQIFFSVVHNPTHVNRQDSDVGPHYRSAIFVRDAEQTRIARAYIDQLTAAKVFRRPIATRLEPFIAFHPAEDEHQDYATRHPDQPYIIIKDKPKVENLQKQFRALYRDTPVLVGAAATQ